METPDIADPLLADLRELLHAPNLAYTTPPQRLRGGAFALVYRFALREAPAPFNQPLVVRILRRGGAHALQHETTIQRQLANLGYPAPPPLHGSESGGAIGLPYFIMPFAPGRMAGLTNPLAAPRTLANLHLQLHRLAVPGGLTIAPSPTNPSLEDLAALLQQPAHQRYLPVLEWLRANQPPPSPPAICHFDLHPGNVLMSGGRVTGVLDWEFAALAEPAADVASTRLKVGTLFDLAAPALARRFKPARLVSPLIPLARWWFLRDYTRAYQRGHALPDETIAYFEALLAVTALAHAEIIEAAESEGDDHPATLPSWPGRSGRRYVQQRLRAITGLTID